MSAPIHEKKHNKILIDGNWLFHKGKISKLKIKKQNPSVFNDYQWEKISIPHDWDIKGPFLIKHKSGTSGGFAPCGTGWYYRNNK
ncbi:MAG: hypothetical protein GF364_05835 [Candidatus Lokiarchaeota archaeon]|nr:hypothetical protein [Candidatus Lokiarchaeota archaeon]